MKKQLHELKIGVLGGGQLGRMLVQKAIDLDLTILILDPDPQAPCKNICTEFHQGEFTDFNTVYNFGKLCDLLTIEIENVNVEALFKLQKEGIKIAPSPLIIQTVQDKGLQKDFFKRNEFPTADYWLIENKKEIDQHLGSLPFVHKCRKGGYDGKGVQIIKSTADLIKVPDVPAVLESLVDIASEISVIVSRNEAGEIKCFPAVDMEFNKEANLVEFLFSPSRLSQHLEDQAKEIAVRLAKELQLVGILAVEMFLTKENKLIINEIAPRPHNSGHQTIEGNNISQYEQMLRAITGLPLGNTEITLPSVMINLLGEKNHTGNAVYSGIENVLKMDGVHIHLYGKKITKPFRKMGHVTVTADTLDNAIQKAMYIQKHLKVIA